MGILSTSLSLSVSIFAILDAYFVFLSDTQTKSE